MKRTNGQGVNVVINSLAGELFEASVRCLSDEGRFLELGKIELFNRTSLDCYMFLKGCGFYGVSTDKAFKGPLAEVVHGLVEKGLLSEVNSTKNHKINSFRI